MLNIPLNLLSNTTQRILSQSNNISYTARGVTRVSATPDDRKADYLFRDFYMVLATGYLTELGFRGLETFYTIPMMTKALDLHRLNQWYPGVQNYTRLPDALRGHVLGSLVKSDSIVHVPDLMKRMQEAKKGALTDAERQQAEALVDHLHRRLNFKDHLSATKVKTGKLSAADAKLVFDSMKKLAQLQHGQSELISLVQTVLDQPVAERQARLSQGLDKWKALFQLAGESERQTFAQLSQQMEQMVMGDAPPAKKTLKALAQQLHTLFEKNALQQEANLVRLEQTLLNGHPLQDKLRGYIREGLQSETTLNLLKRIQKSGTWPKMITSIGLTFLFYGLIANAVDVKLIQPWQERIVKERGTSEDVVKPAYQALVPGLGVLVAGLSDKIAPGFVRRMGYLGRFAAVGAAALATYTGSGLWLAKRALDKPSSRATVQPTLPQQPVVSSPAGRRAATLPRQERPTAAHQPAIPGYQSVASLGATPAAPLYPPFQSPAGYPSPSGSYGPVASTPFALPPGAYHPR